MRVATVVLAHETGVFDAVPRSGADGYTGSQPVVGGGGLRRRAPAVIASAAPAASSAPMTSSPMPIQRAESSSAPMLISAATSRDASSFITTARQSPSSGSHSSVCSPAPDEDAAQNVCVSGAPDGAPPGRRAYSGSPLESRSSTIVALDIVQVPIDLRCRRDADEQWALALAANANGSEERVERPLAAIGIDIGALRDDRVGRRREVLCRRHEEAVVVALRPVDRDERAAPDQQGEGDDADDDADDDEHNSRGSPAARRSIDLSRCKAGLLGNDDRRRRIVDDDPRIRSALVETERRVFVAHEEHVGGDPSHPTVESEDEVEDASRVVADEQQRDPREEHEHADQACLEAESPDPVVHPRGGVAAAAEEDPDDDVVRDRQQPPLHEDESPRQLLGIGDVQTSRVVGDVVESERRVTVGPERAVRVEGDPPRPPQDTEVEVEHPARIAAGDEDREEGDERQDDEREPEEREDDVVRDRQEPLDEPEPAAQMLVWSALDANGIWLVALHAACWPYGDTKAFPSWMTARSTSALLCVSSTRLGRV